MDKILVICGPTATGKTDLALALAKEFNGESVSADSRHVYTGIDIVTGKDIPPHFKKLKSTLKWRDRYLDYYADNQTRIWLTDIVFPNEPFNLSFFKECADLVIPNILARHKLPIVVGVTGLYIRSLLQPLTHIHIPPNQLLRNKLIHKDATYLFNYLNQIDSTRAAALNHSDHANPRRLLRAIEISQSDSTPNHELTNYEPVVIGLTLPRDHAYARIDARVTKRVTQGAQAEVQGLLDQGYAWDLPAMQTSGIHLWQDYFASVITIPELVSRWCSAEHRDFRHQLTYAKKLPGVHWFTADSPGVQNAIINLCHARLKSPTAP